METKHTKGEWSACCLKDRPHFVFGENGFVTICSMFQEQDMFKNISDDELRANAKLIAAAPELLEALESMKIQLGIWNKQSEDTIGYKWAQKAFNAINKATK